MKRTTKIASSALLSLVMTSGVLVGTSTQAQAEPAGNRVVVSAWGSYDHVRNLCLEKQRSYSSMRVRITQGCTWLGQTQQLQHGFAFWWTTA